MRGAVSGGMALGLDELGLAGAFDAAYGSSAGTLNAMWLVSGRVRGGIPTWGDPTLVHELIKPRRLLRGRPRQRPNPALDPLNEQLPALRTGAGITVELHPVSSLGLRLVRTSQPPRGPGWSY